MPAIGPEFFKCNSSANGVIMQGNRVLTEQDFEEVIVPPASLQALTLDAHFQAGFPFQLVVGYLPQRCHVLRTVVPRLHGGKLLRIRLWSSRKVTSRFQCSEFSMLQWARAARNICSAGPARLLM